MAKEISQHLVDFNDEIVHGQRNKKRLPEFEIKLLCFLSNYSKHLSFSD